MKPMAAASLIAKLVSVTLSVLLATTAVAALSEKPLPPREVEVGGFQKYIYWYVKKKVIDVDQVLGKLGIRAHYCTFRQSSPMEDFSYKGVGRCLYQHFIASMKTDDHAGQTYAWIKDQKTGQYYAVEIQWRPLQGGWMKIIKQYSVMSSEKAPKNASDPLPYKEFIGGDLKIILPDDPASAEIILANAPTWLKEKLAALNTVSFHLEPTGRNQEKVVYSGAIKLEERPNEAGEVKIHQDNIQTDMNVVILKRKFYFRGSYKADPADQYGFPELTDPQALQFPTEFPQAKEVLK